MFCIVVSVDNQVGSLGTVEAVDNQVGSLGTVVSVDNQVGSRGTVVAVDNQVGSRGTVVVVDSSCSSSRTNLSAHFQQRIASQLLFHSFNNIQRKREDRRGWSRSLGATLGTTTTAHEDCALHGWLEGKEGHPFPCPACRNARRPAHHLTFPLQLSLA